MQTAISPSQTKFPLAGEMSQHSPPVPTGVALQFPCSGCSLAHTQAVTHCLLHVTEKANRKRKWRRGKKKRERDAETLRRMGGRRRSNERGERRRICHFFRQQAAQTQNTSAQILGRCQKSFPRPKRLQVAGKTLSTEHQARWPLTNCYPDKQPQVRRRWPASNTSLLHSQRHMLPVTLVKEHKS